MKVVVNITQEDITKHGKNVMNQEKCPCAMAVRRAVRKAGAKKASVWSGASFVTINRKRYSYPMAARQLQYDLFERKSPKPISFTLNVHRSVFE